MELYYWEEVHSQIVRETFDGLDIDGATALVGVLNDYEIQYSDALKAAVAPIEGVAPETAPVLTAEYSARVVAQVFGFEINDLLRRYRTSWRSLRSSPVVTELVSRLEDHRFVGRLCSASDVP